MGARLVRDNALSNWVVPGAEHQVRPAHTSAEHLALLLKKLIEESAEVIFAKDDDELEKELDDAIDVLICLYERHTGRHPEEFTQGALYRLHTGESFRHGLVWETPR